MEKYEPYACDNFDDSIFQKVPKNIYKKNGKRKYAIMTMLFGSDSYLPGALTLANSLRKQNIIADLTIMITPDIDKKTKKILKSTYDKVFKIDYIIPPKNFLNEDLMKKREQYTKQYTKLNLFKFGRYKKILFMDADSISIKNINHIFTLHPPAMTYYGFRGNQSHMIENNFEPRLKGDKYQWHQKYCGCCSHGKLIDKNDTDYACNSRYV